MFLKKISRKSFFAFAAVCLMSSVIYISSMKFLLPKPVGLRSWNPIFNYDTHSITQANNSCNPLTPEVLPHTTSMTFNTSLVVRCKESPYVECFAPKLKPIPGKIFKFAYFRRPSDLRGDPVNASNCRISQCEVFDNTVTNETDIVVFYGIELRDNYPVPKRWPHQLYAIQVWKSPFHTLADFITAMKSPWNQRINILMSYRLDANAVFLYNKLRFKPKPLDQRPNYYQIAKNKTRTAVWIVSHCTTQSKREEYVKEMQKYIDVDILGRCGTPTTKWEVRCNTMTKATCNTWSAPYKFYLAFENSICKDYVTETFFKLFCCEHPNIIPVVRGGAEYDKHFPNFTYINTAHFKTPKDLALHLKDLAADLDTYSKYLEYMDLYELIPWETMDCRMCEYAHTHKLPHVSQTYNLHSMLGSSYCHRFVTGNAYTL